MKILLLNENGFGSVMEWNLNDILNSIDTIKWCFSNVPNFVTLKEKQGDSNAKMILFKNKIRKL